MPPRLLGRRLPVAITASRPKLRRRLPLSCRCLPDATTASRPHSCHRFPKLAPPPPPSNFLDVGPFLVEIRRRGWPARRPRPPRRPRCSSVRIREGRRLG